jgi:hypothetical protein
MTLTIELTPEEEARLQAAARGRGVDPAEFARRLLADNLPPIQEEAAGSERDPARVILVKRVQGKFAHTAHGLASESLHRERQADREKEERQIPGFPT